MALIDHLGASGNFDQMRKVADATVEIVGKAGQVLRASQMVSKYDFAKGVQIATKGLQKLAKKFPIIKLKKSNKNCQIFRCFGKRNGYFG